MAITLLILCVTILASKIVPNIAFTGIFQHKRTTRSSSELCSELFPQNDNTELRSMFESDGWKNIAENLSSFPLFTIATPENKPVAYSITIGTAKGEEKTFNIPFIYCDVTEALVELEKTQQMTKANKSADKELKLIPFPLDQAFKLWCDDRAVIVPSKASILQAGAPAGTNQIGQKVPLWCCFDVTEEQEGGLPPKLPLFMSLEDANAAVLEAVAGDRTKVDDLEVVCLSLDGAIEQLVTVPEESPSFHFIPPTKSIKYIEENKI